MRANDQQGFAIYVQYGIARQSSSPLCNISVHDKTFALQGVLFCSCYAVFPYIMIRWGGDSFG